MIKRTMGLLVAGLAVVGVYTVIKGAQKIKEEIGSIGKEEDDDAFGDWPRYNKEWSEKDEERYEKLKREAMEACDYECKESLVKEKLSVLGNKAIEKGYDILDRLALLVNGDDDMFDVDEDECFGCDECFERCDDCDGCCDCYDEDDTDDEDNGEDDEDTGESYDGEVDSEQSGIEALESLMSGPPKKETESEVKENGSDEEPKKS